LLSQRKTREAQNREKVLLHELLQIPKAEYYITLQDILAYLLIAWNPFSPVQPCSSSAYTLKGI
jgi:hypothetical protein